MQPRRRVRRLPKPKPDRVPHQDDAARDALAGLRPLEGHVVHPAGAVDEAMWQSVAVSGSGSGNGIALTAVVPVKIRRMGINKRLPLRFCALPTLFTQLCR